MSVAVRLLDAPDTGRVGGRLRERLGVGGIVAAAFVLLLALAAAFASVVAPYAPNHEDFLNTSSGPSAAHLLGTDELGRDILSRLIWGAQPSLLGPLIVISLATVIALLAASTAVWCGGKVDLVISRILDFFFAFPGLLLAILVVALYGPGLLQCSFSLGIAYTPWIARVTRSAMLKERSKPYIAAVEVQGLSGKAIALRHLIPNVSSVIWSQATISFGYALIDLAALSFLGLNIQPPRADWGVLVNNESALLQGHPAEVIYPGILIIACVSAVTYVGNQLASE
ncbi:MAG: ABC transporter permease [Acidimicrobiaceae bacterium]|nr:ABC transporter permease [Acidimicrobiaceae bacterium]